MELDRSTIIKLLLLGGLLTTAVIFRKQIKKGAKKGVSKMQKTYYNLANDQMIEGLAPSVRKSANQVVKAIEKELGITIKVVSTLRDEKTSNELYSHSRTTAQLRKVGIKNIEGKPKETWKTNAYFGKSYHNFGYAFDIVEVKPQYGYGKGYPISRWKDIGKIAKRYGWSWGGDWKSQDLPHFQKNPMHHSKLLALHNAGKVDNEGYVVA